MKWTKRTCALLWIVSIMVFTLFGCNNFRPDGALERTKTSQYHRPTRMDRLPEPAPAPAPEKKPVHKPEVPKVGLFADAAYPTSDKHMGSVIYIQKAGESTGRVGFEYCYTILVTNLTKRAVENVEVVQTLPDNFEVKNSVPEMAAGSTRTVARWFLGELGPEETREIRVCGLPTKSGSMVFCADVSYSLPGICINPTITEPLLAILKRAPSEVLLCDMIPLTFAVTNTGTGFADDVKVVESLPRGLRTQDGKRDVELHVGRLNLGETKEMTLMVQAETTGEFRNTAMVIGGGGLSAESNTTTTFVRQPVLTIAKRGPEMIYLGRDITYEIAVKNEGDGVASDTILEDVLPANTSFVSATGGGILSGNTVIWNLGVLPPDASREVHLTVKTTEKDVVRNTVTAKAFCAEAVSATTATQVVGIAAILLEVVDVRDPVKVGETETYIITVTNQGTAVGTNIQIVCELEEEMEYVTSTGPTPATVSDDGMRVAFAPLPRLAPREKATWTVDVKAVSRGDVRFRVKMTEDRLTRPVEETEATTFYQYEYFDIFER